MSLVGNSYSIGTAGGILDAGLGNAVSIGTDGYYLDELPLEGRLIPRGGIMVDASMAGAMSLVAVLAAGMYVCAGVGDNAVTRVE